jgi:hypothetical protein
MRMTMKTKHDIKPHSTEVLDEISHQAALVEAERGAVRKDDETWSRALGKQLDGRIAELRRNLLPADAPIEKASPIRPSILALGREALLARIAELGRAMGGSLQYAYRDLRSLSDDDLRRLLDMMEPGARHRD